MIFLVDVDGPLADFVAASLEIINEGLKTPYVKEDIKTYKIFKTIPEEYRPKWLKRCQAPGFCQTIPVVDGAREAVKWMREWGQVKIVSAPMWDAPTWVYDRCKWLEALGIDRGEIHFTDDKAGVDGDVFIDDLSGNLTSWANRHPSGIPVLWGMPYNEGCVDFSVVSSWGEALVHLRGLVR